MKKNHMVIGLLVFVTFISNLFAQDYLANKMAKDNYDGGGNKTYHLNDPITALVQSGRSANEMALNLPTAEMQQATPSQNNRTSDPILNSVLFFLLVIFVLSIPGIILGYQDKLIIYHGRSDLNMTGGIIILSIVTPMFCSNVLWVGIIMLLATLSLLVLSIRKTLRANRTIFKTILAVSSKFVLIVLIIFCGFIAVCFAIASIKSLGKKDYKEALGNFAVSAAGIAGFIYLRKLIERLVKPETMRI